MIRIVRGTFGWRKGSRIIPLNEKSGPVQLDPGTERRLVEVDKIAEYVGDTAPLEVEVTETVVNEETDPESMSFRELGDLLLSKGVPQETVAKLKSKASRIGRLKDMDEPEEAPAFTASGLV